MKGNEIILSSQPKGHFEECIILGTPSPGTILELVPSVAPVSGRFTYQVPQRASGAIGGTPILMADRDQGKLITDAYVTGTRGFIYWPAAGEEFNLLIGDVAGTGSVEDAAIGALFGVQTLTGLMLANSSFASAPFQLLEALHGFITANTLAWFKYLGGQA